MNGEIDIGNKKSKKLLFVCTANICRSPMAAVFFLDAFHKTSHDHPAVLVGSAGTRAARGAPALDEVQRVMTARGFNLSGHRSHPITERVVMESSLILTMESGHKEALRAEFPERAEHILLLTELSGPPFSVWDPVGGELEDYEHCAEFIRLLIEKGYKKILELLQI